MGASSQLGRSATHSRFYHGSLSFSGRACRLDAHIEAYRVRDSSKSKDWCMCNGYVNCN